MYMTTEKQGDLLETKEEVFHHIACSLSWETSSNIEFIPKKQQEYKGHDLDYLSSYDKVAYTDYEGKTCFYIIKDVFIYEYGLDAEYPEYGNIQEYVDLLNKQREDFLNRRDG